MDTTFIEEFFKCASEKPVIEDVSQDGIPNNIIGVMNSLYDNNEDNGFKQEINEMKYSRTIHLKNKFIDVTFVYLAHQDESLLAMTILHAVNTVLNYYKITKKPLTIYAFLTNKKRDTQELYPETTVGFFDSSYHQNIIHASAGLTSGGITNEEEGYIIVTKKHGIINLVIHELFHYYIPHPSNEAKDRKYLFNNLIIPQYSRVAFDTPSQIIYNIEVYAESNGILYTCAYYAYLQSKNIDDMKNKYCKLVENEYIYSVYLTTKLLKYLKYDKSTVHNFFYAPLENRRKIVMTIYFREYIILRSIFFGHLMKNIMYDDFNYNIEQLEKTVEHNIDNIDIYNNKNTISFEYMNNILEIINNDPDRHRDTSFHDDPHSQFWEIKQSYNLS